MDRSSTLAPGARSALRAVVDLLATDPTAPSAARDREQAWRVHVADGLAGLDVPELGAADRIADVGAGAGFPGLVLAAALPGSRVDLVEASMRKCEFMRRAMEHSGIQNASVICGRSESLATDLGREAYDAVTARAVGRLSTLAELASPLLREGGVLVAWKGRRDKDEEDELSRAAPRLAIEPVSVTAVSPYEGSRNRHLHVMRKGGPTPSELPRRPGMAKKRPFGSLS